MTEAREKVLAVLEEFGEAAFTLGELAEMAGVSTGVVKGLVAQGAVREEASPRDAPYPPLVAGPGGGGPHGGAGGGGGGADRGGGLGRLRDDASEGRHRVGEDRGLSRGGGGVPARRAAGAGAAARDRADGRVPRARRAPLRRAARRMAFRHHHDRAAAVLADGGRRGRAACRRRALGAVPAVPGAGAHRRRRGARHLLQAGGGRPLQRPRHGGAARVDLRRAGGAGLGHALARELGECGGGEVPPARPDRALRRGGDARDAGDRHAQRASLPATRWISGTLARAVRRGSRRGSRRSCSSTGAAMRR
jgi:hypothetical protein